MEGVKDHIVSNLHGKATPFLMWKALTELFERNNDQRRLALKDKLRKIKMEKGDSIPKYLTNFFQCRDELGSVGETAGLRATLVRSCVGGDKAVDKGWIFIEE